MIETHPPLRRVRWSTTCRIVPSRYPPVDLFERVADPADWEVLAEIEGLTNDRLRDEMGDLCLVPTGDRIGGPGTSPVMASFTHIGFPSRFTDGSYGVYYAGARIEVALAEVAFHLTRFYSSTDEPAFHSEHRAYLGKLDASLHDIRGGWPQIHNPDSYRESQALGRELRQRGSNGVAYRSARCRGGHCLAAFKPKTVGPVVQGPHFYFEWNGQVLTRYFRIGDDAWQPFC